MIYDINYCELKIIKFTTIISLYVIPFILLIQYDKKQLIMIAYGMRIIVILISLFSFLFLFKEKKTIFPILKLFLLY